MFNFLGNIEAKIDSKARIFIPAAFRKTLLSEGQSSLVLRKDVFQNCLVLYPDSIWQEELRQLKSKLNNWDRAQKQIFRQFVVSAERLEMDTNGRVLIPKRYLQMIGAVSEVTFLGMDDTIEIWGKDVLDSTLLDAEDFSRQIQELMNNDNI